MNIVISGTLHSYLLVWMGLIIALYLWRWGCHAGLLLAAHRRWLAAVLMLSLVTGLVLSTAPRPDQTEHIHASYLTGLGLRPYVDFFEHHHPTIYYLMGPIMAALPRTAVVVDVATGISVFLFLGMAVIAGLLARRLWGAGAGLWAMGLLVAQAGNQHFLTLRPDLMANLLVIGSVAVLATRANTRSAMLSGALLGFAFWFGPKPLLFIALPPVTWLICRSSPTPWARQFMAYLAGAAGTFGVFLLWLHGMGLLDPWYQWCVEFNAQIITAGANRFDVSFPLILAALATVGLLTLYRRAPASSRRYQCTILAAVVLALVGGVSRRSVNPYDLQMVVLLACVLAAEPARDGFTRLNRRSIALAAAALALYFVGLVVPMAAGLYHGDYFRARAGLDTLIRAAGDEAVVCATPHHPLVTRDAVDLWHGYQWRAEFLSQPMMLERLTNVGPQLRRAQPTLIYDHSNDDAGIEDLLLSRGLAEETEARRLRHFLAGGYTLRHLDSVTRNGAWFWVRNDRLPLLPREK